MAKASPEPLLLSPLFGSGMPGKNLMTFQVCQTLKLNGWREQIVLLLSGSVSFFSEGKERNLLQLSSE